MNIPQIYNLKDLKLFSVGKVREIYELHNDKLLIITTDRISAYDVIMNQTIPGKGKVLNTVANFWFDFFKDKMKNHIISTEPWKDYEELKEYKNELEGRSIVVHKCKPLPIEAIVRGYLAGSGLKEYQKKGTVCNIELPRGLVNSSKLENPIFTPSTKAEQGFHDENISFERMKEIMDPTLAEKVKQISIELYVEAREYAASKGIIIADTKFEFGMIGDELVLIDEVLTPDSSRFWSIDNYKAGKNQASFDKQFLRDYLEGICTEGKWDKNAPAPKLPEEVIRVTKEKYESIVKILK